MEAIGLTGGIGMGKSTAAEFLRRQGIPIVDSDALARQIVQPGAPALEEIRAAFGPEYLTGSGELDRGRLARLVFADAQARARLEQITHPRIRALWREQLDTWRSQQVPRAVAVIPLLYETGAEAAFDRVLCVACSGPVQQQRLRARGWSAAEIQQRIAAQWPIEQKIARADQVVWTDGALEIHQAQWRLILPSEISGPASAAPRTR